MSHLRSEQAYQERQKKYKSYQDKKDLANSILRDFSLLCWENHDKVWHPETEKAVKERLKEAFEGDTGFACNIEYGQVLNHFGI